MGKTVLIIVFFLLTKKGKDGIIMAIEDKDGRLHGDEDGKFVPKDKVEAKAYDSKDNFSELNKRINSGAKSGALNPNSERAIKHGKMMYQTFRNIKSDIPKIAETTGLSIAEIKKIKDYIFFNSEFDEDFDQAQSWDRLRHGVPVEADIIFIKHEILELSYREKGMDYDSAHALAQKEFNYQKAIKEYNYAIVKEKRNNK